MLIRGILNPHVLALLARVRHTNRLVIADRGFPSWPEIETIDLSLVDDVPTVLQVLAAIRPNFVVGRAWMAEEFAGQNTASVREQFAAGLAGVEVVTLPHVEFKRLVPGAIGLIRTGDTIQYGNVMIESG
jgi:D-ribose pyranase